MDKFSVTKIVRSPKKTVLTLVIYLLCVVLAVSIGMGICYAYFTDKVDGTGSVTSGILNIRYIEDSTSTVEANNLVVFNTRDNETNLLTSGSSTLMPGDKLNVKGAIENVENIDCYSVFKVEVEKTYNDGSKDITYSDISWFNLDGERITQNNNGRYTIPASELNVGDIKDVDILFELGAEEINNSYAGKNVVVTLTLCAYQFEALERETYETDSGSAYLYDSIALQTTHKLIGNEIDVWGENTVASTSLSGEGTEANPYLISSVADLLYFAEYSMSAMPQNTEYYKLTKNLDLKNKPIPTMFLVNMVFNGNGYKMLNINITTLYESGGVYASGFFEVATYSKIENLLLQNITIDITSTVTGTTTIGGLVGIGTDLEVNNCAVIGSNINQYDYNVTLNSQTAYVYVSGLVGNINGGKITNSYCIADISLSCNYISFANGIGITDTSTEVRNSYFIGNIISSYGSVYITDGSGLLDCSFAITTEDSIDFSFAGNAIDVINCAYINDNSSINFTKVGSNQTEMQLTANNMKDVATLRDAMGFSYEHWINDGTNYPTLRVFVK